MNMLTTILLFNKFSGKFRINFGWCHNMLYTVNKSLASGIVDFDHHIYDRWIDQQGTDSIKIFHKFENVKTTL